jgi:hypothetical protein
MSLFLISLSVCEFALVAGFAVRKQKLIQVAPSLVWFALMTLPFVYQFQFFPSSPRNSQSIGLLLISTALAAGDLFAIKNKGSVSEIKIKLDKSNSGLIYLVTVLVIVTPIIHYRLSDSIPILDQYFGEFNPNQVSEDRENFIKLLDVPYFVKVLFNWVTAIFGPIIIIWFYLMKRFLYATLLLIWVIFYALSSSADAPIVILCWALLFALVYATHKHRNLSNYLSMGIATALIAVIVSGIWLGNTAVAKQGDCGVKAQSGFTPGDVMRSCSTENQISINPMVNRLGYRIFLTPVEVSNHWYDYFDGNPSKKRNFMEVFERANLKQASNKVGVWAYTERFPQSYGKTISANGSIDADAYSLGGWFSILLVSIILFAIRIFISLSVRNEPLLTRILEGIGLGQLAFLPNSAPLQAMLLPQGLGLIILLLLILRIEVLRMHFKKFINCFR